MKQREKQWQPHIQEMPIHRDFHLKQMFYENGRIWVVDWDLFCKGDPALDLGNFLVYLETHVTENLSHLIHAFLTGYFTDNAASVFRRVWLYKGFTYLRLACKSFRLQQGVEKTKEMLSQMERCFEREDH
jgi:thiamine kinase-like enzyme